MTISTPILVCQWSFTTISTIFSTVVLSIEMQIDFVVIIMQGALNIGPSLLISWMGSRISQKVSMSCNFILLLRLIEKCSLQQCLYIFIQIFHGKKIRQCIGMFY